MGVELLIRKNSDPSLPASHLMEINFTVSDTFIGGSVAGLPGVLLKNEELVQGAPLVGASARVVGNSFLFALSASPEDSAANNAADHRRASGWTSRSSTPRASGRSSRSRRTPAAEAMFNEVFAAWGADGLSCLVARRPRCGSARPPAPRCRRRGGVTSSVVHLCCSVSVRTSVARRRRASRRRAPRTARPAAAPAGCAAACGRARRAASGRRTASTARWLPMSGKAHFGQRVGDRLARSAPRRAGGRPSATLLRGASDARTASRTGRGSRPAALRAAAAAGPCRRSVMRAGGRRQEAGDQVEQGRLARAAGAGDGGDLARHRVACVKL